MQAESTRALKAAYALTLDTQTVPEAVDALIEMVRTARARAEQAERERDRLNAVCEFSYAENERLRKMQAQYDADWMGIRAELETVKAERDALRGVTAAIGKVLDNLQMSHMFKT